MSVNVKTISPNFNKISGPMRFLPSVVIALLIIGCGTNKDGPIRKEAGPRPYSGSGGAITRLRVKRGGPNVRMDHTLWDEGDGPIEPAVRVRALVDAVPKDITERLRSTRRFPAQADGTLFDQPLYRAFATVVSLHPDVMIMSVRGRNPIKPYEHPFAGHTSSEDNSVELIDVRGTELSIDAGNSVPWSEEIHVISTDPNVESGLLSFVDGHATILLPKGKLVLVHHKAKDKVEVQLQ